MKYALFSALLAGSALATPVSNQNIPAEWKRSMERNLEYVRRESGLSDTDILNFALTLEHLEDNFYRTGLASFDQADFDAGGYSPRLRTNIGDISSDETTHVQTLTAALGDSAVPACKYDFGLTDVPTFLTIANILEGVGVTAYLGAAALITDPNYLTIAGSILTVEARHSSYLRDSVIPAKAPFPQPFDVPLTATSVFTLASAFITKCPPAANLGITPFPALALKPGQNDPLRRGMWVVLDIQRPTKVVEGKVAAAWFTVTGPIFSTVHVVEERKGHRVRVQIPPGVAGQSYVALTKDESSADDGNIIAGPAIVNIQAPYTFGGFPQ